jgi:hypothetical protein
MLAAMLGNERKLLSYASSGLPPPQQCSEEACEPTDPLARRSVARAQGAQGALEAPPIVHMRINRMPA